MVLPAAGFGECSPGGPVADSAAAEWTSFASFHAIHRSRIPPAAAVRELQKLHRDEREYHSQHGRERDAGHDHLPPLLRGEARRDERDRDRVVAGEPRSIRQDLREGAEGAQLNGREREHASEGTGSAAGIRPLSGGGGRRMPAERGRREGRSELFGVMRSNVRPLILPSPGAAAWMEVIAARVDTDENCSGRSGEYSRASHSGWRDRTGTWGGIWVDIGTQRAGRTTAAGSGRESEGGVERRPDWGMAEVLFPSISQDKGSKTAAPGRRQPGAASPRVSQPPIASENSGPQEGSGQRRVSPRAVRPLHR